jgi:hypothetical protein
MCSRGTDETRKHKTGGAIGRALLDTAQALDVIAEPKYGNGLGIIAVHAAIAYTDALTVAYREVKSVDGDHTRAAEVLVHALGQRVDAAQVKRLRRMLTARSHVSYGGSFHSLEEGRELLTDVTRYESWAEKMYENRPG